MSFRSVFYLFFLVFISSCSSLPFMSVEEHIANRVQLRWAELIKSNWSGAYAFETAGYRESHSLEQFKAQFGQAVSWKKITVSKIELNEMKEKAVASVIVSFEMMLPGQGLQESEAYLTEIWLLDDGVWNHYTK